jgi:hypothetical protein
VTDGDDDKVNDVLGVPKTIWTVCVLSPSCSFKASDKVVQVVSCIKSSPEILSQVQEVILPIIQFTLENKLIGMSALFSSKGHADRNICRFV